MSLQKEQVHDFIKKYNQGRISRRQFLRAVTTVGGVTVAQSMMPGFRLATAMGARNAYARRHARRRHHRQAG